MYASRTRCSPTVGVVVIGRNEGERLRRALSPLTEGTHAVIYVDSGSTDGSVELVRSLNLSFHILDSETPYSAARARSEGVERLLRTVPTVRYIQFLDGDCVLDADWLTEAASFLDSDPPTAIVCGQLTERPTAPAIYSKISPQTWKQPTGEIDACGGIFMMRTTAYVKVGGFNPALLTREESDLCARIRQAGDRIVRLALPMAQHDSGINSFHQWWNRAVWGGYGDALSIRESPMNRRRLQRMWAGVLIPHGLVIAGLIGLFWSNWSVVPLILGFIGIGMPFVRTARARWRQGDGVAAAVQFSAFASLRNMAGGIGFVRYYLLRDRVSSRPDPRPSAYQTQLQRSRTSDKPAYTDSPTRSMDG